MKKNKPNIICEIGLNHLGKKEYLLKYLKIKDIDALTIQVIPSQLYKGSLKKYKLDLNEISNFINLVKKSNKKIGIALTDHTLVDFFIKKKIDFYKVLSKDLKNILLIKKLIKTNKKIFLSTGTSNFKEIKDTLKKINTKKIELIHTSFSKKLNKINFKRIQELKNIFKLPVSYGNHSPHLNTIPLSINYNPSSIFFYVKLNNKFDYPDNLHAVKIKDIRKILDSIDFNHSKFIKPGN
tara:strand:- start:170 stop:883 length:714 start_codon:yes stop_codon:yes gene_type:complete